MTNVKSLLVNWSFEDTVTIKQVTSGLINQTYIVCAPEPIAVLQRLNTDIFSPRVHEDIDAITKALVRKELPTPILLPCSNGDLWHTDAQGGVWRALSHLGNRTIEKLHSPHDAREAGALIGRFHSALAEYSWDFRSVRPGAHDTPAHLARLQQAVVDYRGHRLWESVAPLAAELQQAWDNWSGSSDLPTRIIHGDLKISNVRFQDRQALCLIDLDTLAQGTLDIELGDAMRSWCNPASEDSLETHFDLALFESAMAGYAAGCKAAPPSHHEWSAIAPGIERICIELAARFAWDALAECYFGFNEQYGGRGEHNLLRARGQAQLAKSVRNQRDATHTLMSRLWRDNFSI